ncbi:MAG TPA: signal recognition particle protein [Thermomicrobiales bacterium]
MFESLSDRLQAVFQRLGSRTRITEEDVTQAMREVRIALIEADVNLGVVKSFVARVREQAVALVGADAQRGLNPAQQIIALVNDALIELLGRERVPLTIATAPPTIIMLVGLQGSGKTTHAAKLALHLQKQGTSALLVAADIYRPAAVTQLVTLGQQVGVPVHEEGTSVPPVQIVGNALADARARGAQVVIIDTAGRLQIDDAMMNELVQIRDAFHPTETLLVADAMTGQAAVEVAQTFNERVGLTGLILTKVDGDARGGAALSIREVTGVPIKFVGVGERVDQLDPFYPERMASRILGMGDMLSLIEKAQQNINEADAAEMQEKLLEGSFNLEDFLAQMQQVKKLGPMGEILKMLPGIGSQLKELQAQVDDKEIARVEAIIHSMTREERRHPEILNYSRQQRIANGSGTNRAEVRALLKQFGEAQKMMSQMGRMAKRGGGRGGLRGLMGGGGPQMDPAALQEMLAGGMNGPAASGPRPPRPVPNKNKKKKKKR